MSLWKGLIRLLPRPASPIADDSPAPFEPTVVAPDPPFEGGGGVLMSPAFWEKAGWGVALLVGFVAAG